MNYLIQFNDRKVVFQHEDRQIVEDFAFEYYGYPNPQSRVVIASDDEAIQELQGKLSRRNMQIKELKERIKSLIASYEYHCPEVKSQSIAIKNAKEVINR